MQGWPIARAGQRIGLLGGSFDPAHAGHVHLTQQALVRFGLDRVWWLVSPGNPLKRHGPAPLADRIAAARFEMQHPRVVVTGLEAELQTRFTAATLRKLLARYPGVRFTWLMGADNLTQFDQWQDWRWIMNHVPVGVLARPNDHLSARLSMAARVYRAARLPDHQSHGLAAAQAPAWCFVNMPMKKESSSAIRAAASGDDVTAGSLPVTNKGR
ncbi:nicotinate-nucleotide adenylyltransferase [Loktanella sp. SALINAS62]|uniref:nicotinate-nucleotide adenylyltransferase n=1 Tax=Loktanella sp. SALINAS62 TaxID=2706124 RepID=UPI001B8C7FD3|nr:nicotinate-nucleotide adenylyltransferase [Loktanella sp. SALINAS62]MBS1304041.1 nicotinate-nucleotide adenylyltransferase [Loktanella sp. SALINAS62]